MEKKTKARGQDTLTEMMKATQPPTAAYNIEEWMWGLEEEAHKRGVRNDDADNCRPEKRSAHSQCAG